MKKLLLFICLLLLSGCSDYLEIGEEAVVAGIGVDNAEGSFALSVELIDITSGEAGAAGRKTVTGGGDTFTEALKNAVSRAGRDFYLGHTQVVILGPGLTPEMTRETISFLGRDETFHLSTRLLCALCPASEALFSQPMTQKINSYEITKLMDKDQGSRAVPDCTVSSFARDLLDPGRESMMPVVFTEYQGDILTTVISGAMVYKNCERVKEISAEKTPFLMILRGEKATGELKTQDRVCLIKSASERWECTPSGARVHINMRLSFAEGESPLEAAEWEKAAESIFSSVIGELREADGACIGRRVEMYCPGWYYSVDWEKELENYPVSVSVKVSVETDGRLREDRP